MTNPHEPGTFYWAVWEVRVGARVMRQGGESVMLIEPDKTNPPQSLLMYLRAHPRCTDFADLTTDDIFATDWSVVE